MEFLSQTYLKNACIRNIRKYTMYQFLTISREIRPLAALYPSPLYFLADTIEGVNAVGMSIPAPAITVSGDRKQGLRSQL